MTDRFNYLTVALEQDIREDDAQMLISAIRQLRGVLSVEGNVVSADSWVAVERVRNEFREKLFDVLYPKKAEG